MTFAVSEAHLLVCHYFSHGSHVFLELLLSSLGFAFSSDRELIADKG